MRHGALFSGGAVPLHLGQQRRPAAEARAGVRQAAFTGDGDTDMAFASALGFWALGASWGYRPRTVLAEQGADALLETPEELQKLLLG